MQAIDRPNVGGGVVEVAADDNGRIGVRKQLCAGQQVVGGRSKGVLVSSTVHRSRP